MGKSNYRSGIDFVVSFFIEDRMISRLLSDVLKNKNNRLFLEALGLPSDFVIPFAREEIEDSIVYSIKQAFNDRYDVTLNGRPYNADAIQSGDSFVFSNRSDNRIVKALLIATSDIEPEYRKYKISDNSNISIGRSPTNDIVCNLTKCPLKDRHAVIRIDKSGQAMIEGLHPTSGIYINGRLTDSAQLKPFDEVFILGLSLVYMGEFIAVRNLRTDCSLPLMKAFAEKRIGIDEAKRLFVNTPRVLKSPDVEEIEIDAPPNPFTADKTPLLLTLGPSLTMSLAMIASLGVSITNAINGGSLSTIVVSGVMAVSMLLGSLMWPALLRRYQKRRIAEEEYHRKTRYLSYISDIEKELIAKRDRTTHLLNNSLSPSPEILCSFLDSEKNKLHLWERSCEDDDFLDVRLGLGSRPSSIQLKTPRQGFQLYEDELRDLPINLTRKYSVLNNVPLTLDIYNNRTIGIIGDQCNILALLNETILNVISLHSYEEAKIVLITSPKEKYHFETFKNVPHVWSNDKRIRFYATKPDEVHYIFNALDDIIKQRKQHDKDVHKHIPHYIVIVTEPSLIEKEAFLRHLNDADNQVGITTLFAYGDITKLPKSCKTIVLSNETRSGYYIKNKNANKFIPFTPDNIEDQRIRSFARDLSRLPIKRDYRSMGIVDRISFLQMYKAGNVKELDIESHWDDNNSAKSLAAPIGVMVGGEVFNLDLHEAYHGCHGLVAGTTGSGKSEFLQAFILSLAINYSPKEVAFVLVDFKGGDMARPFMAKPFAPALPHLSATISNLSGNILYRALVSLEAEITSRQRIFNESATALGVDKLDINTYHKYYKSGRLDTPLPHLIIIIDEFAQLKTQQPDFLTQLINVAQVGRSLGIHLILATQKPSGIVDPQIMSNSHFKVCLKVADKQDSIDMVNKPDAAMIKNPGRMYLQVGYDEIYECIQSGYSGADYVPTKTYMPDEEITVQMIDNTANPIHSARIDLSSEKTDRTQLEAIVAEIVALGQKKGIAAKPLWLDMLPERIVLQTLAKGHKGLCNAIIGLADYVVTQEQKTLTFDFVKGGHIGLYGASGTGKTTFLQTLVYSMVCEYGYTPEELNIYAMDFGGRNLGYLSGLPHTGGVVFADEEEKLSELVVLLHEIIDERKRLFADSSCGTFADYHAIRDNPLPAILVLVDDYASFREKYMDISDSLLEIIGSGRTFGVYFVITGSTRNAIHYKVTEHISSYFTLKMNDPSNYLDILNQRPPITPEDISGRGITVVNRKVVAFQTAIAFDGETEADRLTAICQKYSELASSWCGYQPIRLGYDANGKSESIDSPASNYSPIPRGNPPESILDDSRNLILGTSKSGVLLYGIRLYEDYKVCVCADKAEDLEKCYRGILSNGMRYGNRRFVFIDDDRGIFRNMVGEFHGCRYIRGATEFDLFIEEWKTELNSRLETPGEQHDPLFIIFSEFNGFFDMITDDQAAFMRKVFRYIDSAQYRICFLCGFDVNGSKNNDSLFMSLVVNAENYVFSPDSYKKAAAKIETLPLIPAVNNRSSYLCLREKSIETRW